MMTDAASHAPHPLHAADRAYRETNCYTDVLIELLHSRGLEPLAGFGHLVRTDFEGDQFTFFKMPPGDLEALFGIDVHEIQPVGVLPDQIERQIQLGRTMLVEVDSFYLPDTAATDYRRNHVKTTVAVEAIDRDAQQLRYFHNTGLHRLSGEDYRGLFRLEQQGEPHLPPYLELVRFGLSEPLEGEALREAAIERLAFHLRLRPPDNPFERFGAQLTERLPALVQGDSEAFHAYAFATARMAGAAFDLLTAHLRWLAPESDTAPLGAIVSGCQVLSFRLARRRLFDPDPMIAAMAGAWAEAMASLEQLVH